MITLGLLFLLFWSLSTYCKEVDDENRRANDRKRQREYYEMEKHDRDERMEKAVRELREHDERHGWHLLGFGAKTGKKRTERRIVKDTDGRVYGQETVYEE
jgi:hypothetical protein